MMQNIKINLFTKLSNKVIYYFKWLLSYPMHLGSADYYPSLTGKIDLFTNKGDSVISVILNKFNRNEDLSRKINLRLFDEKLMLAEKEIVIDENKEIPTKDILPENLTNGAVWYVFSGSRLEDLNIFSTFYPKNKAGYVEHAF